MEDSSERSTRFPVLRVALPGWIDAYVEDRVYATDAERMAFVVQLAQRNIQEGGGPFAAAVFDRDTGALIAPGVNLVVPQRWSSGHAEMVATALAQQILGTHDLGAAGQPRCELVSSVEPCAMCLGAVPWSGVTRLVCGARDADARAIGFDEGAKPAEWQSALAANGIEVMRDVLREQAADVLRAYAEQGGAIYNGRQADA